MGVFDYKNAGSEVSKALYSDAMAITLYSYHNLDNGFAVGYQQNGFGLGLPATLVKALIGGTDAQGVIPGVPWNPDSEKAALAAVKAAGWTPISATQLGYDGKTDGRGTFFGEKAGYTTGQAEVLGKYDASGHLTSIGISFRGTSGPRETVISDTIGDAINDLLAAIGPKDYARNYSANAFEGLLKSVAAFAVANGLAGKDVLVSGHSLGGLAVNSMADLSKDHWGGFYKEANYIAFASPTQSGAGTQVLNIGYENDPVFRALNGSSLTPATLGVHDANKASATNNIVSFNDHYASDAWNVLPFSIGNVATWISHLPTAYGDGMNRILHSKFYDLTSKDSTIIVANLSDPAREKTWVQDLNRNAETHSGATFIIGSEASDLLKGGRGNDYLEGGGGNDTFRDEGGYNIILGGQGNNTLDLQKSLGSVDIANDGQGTLYIRDAQGGITIAKDIGTLISSEPHLVFLTRDVAHKVGNQSLSDGAYVSSQVGGSGADTLTAKAPGEWLLGNGGNDHLIGAAKGGNLFIGGAGNDLMDARGGGNTFLFNGAFGQDRVTGFQASDKLVFMGYADSQGHNILDHARVVGQDTVLSFGADSVTLVGVGLDTLKGASVVIA
ncbi:polyurethanase [Pseudomonas gingeri]|uniref:polyurethane esterase n=1 Tax=Pseudomonas gingeri TaxID=117681 RepID=UPI0015A1159B|nr:polyurethanase [Pseudomonas gingeri]NVZ66733.1 polyurethanase [Pseudomonas gingeri]NVZ75444.1 polyurethanase [Pseudomonas gingeri]NWA11185.1 polyurethanase [Pseudomonas gingeri]